MDALRSQVAGIQAEERALLKQRLEETDEAFGTAVRSGLVSGLLGIFLALTAAWLLRRAGLARERQQWLQSGQALLSEKLMGDQRVEQLGENALRFLNSKASR